MLLIELPWPPSINHYYRRVGNKTLISRDGRDYRLRVEGIIKKLKLTNMTGDLAFTMEAYPPDRRRRDLDNLQKSLWDSLQHAGVYKDDSQVKEFHAYMREPIDNGMVVVQIQEL